jgi:hydrogenase maturation factor HypF (carbamoyltransferase family)
MLLLTRVQQLLGQTTVWVNRMVPPNDGGISLGQAALAAARDAS